MYDGIVTLMYAGVEPLIVTNKIGEHEIPLQRSGE